MNSAALLAAGGFSWNPAADWQALTSQAFMRNALLAGTLAAITCSTVGYFVVLRGLTFAADALTHVGFAGASGAVLLGVPPVAGLLMLTTTTAVAIGALEERLRGRDVVIGLVLVGALGLGVLFLRLSSGYSNEAYALLFGDILALATRDLVVLGIAATIAIAALIVLFRPLLFASLDEEVAESRGVPTRMIAIGFVLIVAIAAAAATQFIGALLAVSLIVAPAASARRLTHKPALGMAVSVALALVVVWLGLALGYWIPLPVSFFITSAAALAYGTTLVATAKRETRGAPTAVQMAPQAAQ